MFRLAALAGIFIVVMIFHACDNESVPPEQQGPTPFEFPDLKYFPTKLNIPKDNPMTVEGVELGRYLFYDGRLSGRTQSDSLMSCGSCHRQSQGFEFGTDRFSDGHPRGLPTPEFPQGKPTPNMTLSTVNLVFNPNGYMWNGFLEESNEKTSIPGYDFTGVENLA